MKILRIRYSYAWTTDGSLSFCEASADFGLRIEEAEDPNITPFSFNDKAIGQHNSAESESP